MGFIDDLIKDFDMIAAVEASKDSTGKPDPFIATGIVRGARGSLSFNDTARLGTFLGAQGAFDDSNDSWLS